MASCRWRDAIQRFGKCPVVMQQGFGAVGWGAVVGGMVFRVSESVLSWCNKVFNTSGGFVSLAGWFSACRKASCRGATRFPNRRMGCCRWRGGFQHVGKRPVVVQQGFRAVGWFPVVSGVVFRVSESVLPWCNKVFDASDGFLSLAGRF